MKGLLLKDFYITRSVLFIILLVFIIIGGALSVLTSPWVLTVLATALLGMVSITTINIDKTSGWRKTAGVLPVSKKAVMDSKYVLYLLLSGIGFTAGIALGVTASLIKNQFDFHTMLLFIAVSAAMALLAGNFSIPCSLILSEEKSMISLLLSYPLSSIIFVGIVLLIDNKLTACGVAVAAGILLYALSWLFSRKSVSCRDIA